VGKGNVKTLSGAFHYYFRAGGDTRRALYVAGRKLQRPGLSAERRRLAQELEASAPFDIPKDAGYRVFPPEYFAESAEVVAAAHQVIRDADMRVRLKKANKAFFARMFDPATLTLASPFMRLALRPDVLAAVSVYLDAVPILQFINVFLSNHVDHEPMKSQLYHCDSDDTTQVKIFEHCTDVKPENGPLTILGAATSARLRRELHYRHDHRITDEQAAEATRTDEHVMLGPTGTTCFVDTSRCFHYGSRVGKEAEPRVIMMIQYLTPYAFILPGDPRRIARFRNLVSPEHSRLQRLVLGAE
jgi:hypothetical protein